MEILIVHWEVMGKLILHGDTFTFTCDDGYELGGSTSRTCGDDGSWSGTDTTCTRGRYYQHKSWGLKLSYSYITAGVKILYLIMTLVQDEMEVKY